MFEKINNCNKLSGYERAVCLYSARKIRPRVTCITNYKSRFCATCFEDTDNFSETDCFGLPLYIISDARHRQRIRIAVHLLLISPFVLTRRTPNFGYIIRARRIVLCCPETKRITQNREMSTKESRLYTHTANRIAGTDKQ